MSTHDSALRFTPWPHPKPTGKRCSTVIALFAVFILGLPGVSRAAAENTLMVMGDSLSAAYGVQVEDAWVSLLEQRLDQKDLDWEVANESISGETTDGGLNRLPDLLAEIDPELVILELGGNDGLRGFPPEVIRSNLAKMIELSRESGAEVLLVGMQIPPNYGRAYTEAFRTIYPELAQQYDTALVPFFLEGIYNQAGAMQDDGIHPSASAQPQLLENVWPELSELLKVTDTASAN